MSKYVYINFYWLWSCLIRRGFGKNLISLVRSEFSLMTRFNSLIGHKKFPVRARREFPSTALKLLPYLARLLGPRGPNSTKFPVFSQLAGKDVDVQIDAQIVRSTVPPTRSKPS